MGDERGERSEQHTPGELKHLGRGGSGAHRGGRRGPEGRRGRAAERGPGLAEDGGPRGGGAGGPEGRGGRLPKRGRAEPGAAGGRAKGGGAPEGGPGGGAEEAGGRGLLLLRLLGLPEDGGGAEGGRLGRLPEALRWGGGRGSVAQRGASGRRGTRDGPVRTCG